MKTLINISNENGKQVVNARELHTFLGVKTKFTEWINRRIDEYDFIENQDFNSFSQNWEKVQTGRPLKEYAITLDMAKELSMIERTDKGKQARRYFIECEKLLFSSATKELPIATEIRKLPIDFSVSERRKHTQIELIKTIKLNLFRGDLKRIAEREGMPYSKVLSVMSNKVFDYDIIYILYEKARENLMIIDTEIKTLTDDLKSLAV